MAGFFDFANSQEQASFGRELMSWVYKPQKSNQFLYYLLGLAGAAVLFFLAYGSDLIPWLRKLPEYTIYILLLLFGPVVNYLRSMGRDQKWTLYEHGFKQELIERNKTLTLRLVGSWQHYKSALYQENLVVLVPAGRGRRKVKIRIMNNAAAVYSLCRERISLAQSGQLQSKMRRPKTPNTPEQRRIAQLEKRIGQRGSSSFQKSVRTTSNRFHARTS